MKKNDCLFSDNFPVFKIYETLGLIGLFKKVNNPIKTNETISCAGCHMSV